MLFPSQADKSFRIAYYILIMIILVVGLSLSFFVYERIDVSSKMHMVDRANTIAKVVSSEELTLLDGSESDLSNPAYLRIKNLLISVRSVNHDIRFIYIIGNSDSQLFFYADSEEDTSEDYSPPGQLYEEASEPMHALFEDGFSRFEGPSSDRWGTWISAYAPVFDTDGNVTALVGMDTPAKEYLRDLIFYASLPLVITLLFIILLLTFKVIKSRELRYVEQKAEFLSIASHEIRTPLTGIRWAIETLLGSTSNNLDASSKKMLAGVYTNCTGLIARINNLLNVTTLESGKKIELHMESVHIYTIVKEVTESLVFIAAQRNVSLIIDESLSPELIVKCDPQNIRHVFANLISNAVKYTNTDTKVLISYKEERGKHVFSIIDQGKGIAKKEQGLIFKGYHRTKDARTSAQYGNGLGLYLTHKVVHLHKGKITIESTEGNGATFNVILPM